MALLLLPAAGEYGLEPLQERCPDRFYIIRQSKGAHAAGVMANHGMGFLKVSILALVWNWAL